MVVDHNTMVNNFSHRPVSQHEDAFLMDEYRFLLKWPVSEVIHLCMKTPSEGYLVIRPKNQSHTVSVKSVSLAQLGPGNVDQPRFGSFTFTPEVSDDRLTGECYNLFTDHVDTCRDPVVILRVCSRQVPTSTTSLAWSLLPTRSRCSRLDSLDTEIPPGIPY